MVTKIDASMFDAQGKEIILDADADTSITADTDDQIDIKIAGADDFRFTANNFNVLSGSTLTVDSGATITNSGTATGFGSDNTPSFAAHRTSSQSIPNDTATKVQCDVELWDTDGAYDNSSNYRFTVPVGGAGKYCVTWMACIVYVDDGELTTATIYKNGSSAGFGVYAFYSANTNQGPYLSSTWVVELADSDYLELYVHHTEGGTVNLLDDGAFFSAYRLIGV